VYLRCAFEARETVLPPGGESDRVTALRRRRYVLAGLLIAVGLLTAVILRGVLEIVFSAITVAYVFCPIRQRLVERGLSRRLASGFVTMLAFVAVVVLLAPIRWTVFRRRQATIGLLQDLPDLIPIEGFGVAVTVNVARLADSAALVFRELAGSLALSSLVIALQLSLFTFLLYKGVIQQFTWLAPCSHILLSTGERCNAKNTIYLSFDSNDVRDLETVVTTP